jgi:hypothetical protein
VSETSYRGGARIGWVNASWPFARLTVSSERLALASLGTYEFNPSQVVSIEPYGSIPLLASGIRINHNRADYPEKIIFWCMGNRDKVLTELGHYAFSPNGRPTERASGFPIRWSVVVAVIALWNVLFMLDWPAQRQSREPWSFALLALLALFGLATAIRASPRVQRIVLREGHQVGEITAFIGHLLQIVAGLLSLVFGGMWLAHALPANPSIEGTSSSRLRLLPSATHVKR